MKNGSWLCGLALSLAAIAFPVRAQAPVPPAPPSQPAATPAPAATTPAAPAMTPAAPATSAAPPAVLPKPTPEGGHPLFDLGNPDGPVVPFEGGVRQPRFYFIGEYLLWWIKQDKVPPLSSTSTNPFDNGIIGNPTTTVLFGGDGIGGGSRSGFRFTAGVWCDDCKDTGYEIRGFYLAPQNTNFNANGSQFPTLARPFFNVNQGVEFAEITSFPGRFSGSQSINDTSKFFGGEVNTRCRLCCGCDYRLDVFGGFRYLDFEESLKFTESFMGLSTAPAPFTNTNILATDFFSTRNQFYGGQVGLLGEYNIGAFSVEARGQLALGDTHQDILIDGTQVVTPIGSTKSTTFPGALLALPSNIGRFNRDRFSVVPEGEINVGYLVTPHLRAFIGYDILYWNNVARPGGQIDRNLDVTQIPNFLQAGAGAPGKTQPSAPRDSTDIWVQGVTFGLEFRF